ncbi:hypothetical protein ABT354_33690 [Streptomyces sp. NPDC000594]|uniref:hypothetical protein n=1 Tax=Streptomyces sp. NPDC000594 TaxID=3154261 RepID=UPI00332392B0
MTSSDALLARLERDAALASALARHSDFDIERRDPVEEVVLPGGTPLQVIAGCGAGGTYFLCGDGGADGGARPVLYADSEGQATLIGADLLEALTVLVVLPFWQDLAPDRTLAEAGAEPRADEPSLDAERDRLIEVLGLPPLSETEAADLLAVAAARTVPGHLPRVPRPGYEPYEPLLDGTALFRRG